MRISDWSSDVCSSDLAVVVVHLAGASLRGIGPVVLLPLLQEANDAIEGVLVHQEGEVLSREVDAGLCEVEDATVAEADLMEVSDLDRDGQPEDLGEELRRCLGVGGREASVVEVGG